MSFSHESQRKREMICLIWSQAEHCEGIFLKTIPHDRASIFQIGMLQMVVHGTHRSVRAQSSTKQCPSGLFRLRPISSVLGHETS